MCLYIIHTQVRDAGSVQRHGEEFLQTALTARVQGVLPHVTVTTVIMEAAKHDFLHFESIFDQNLPPPVPASSRDKSILIRIIVLSKF